MENSIIYAKIAVSEKKFYPKLSSKYHIFSFIVAIMLQILNNV